ncbi:uncharacterized protein LOC141608730 [Silene latifolia]|uniref:uncharacterized protein LOC141608730 n=1 Tax=Silene latifolia TaxID=37657 RepID=UPI003D76EF1C
MGQENQVMKKPNLKLPKLKTLFIFHRIHHLLWIRITRYRNINGVKGSRKEGKPSLLEETPSRSEGTRNQNDATIRGGGPRTAVRNDGYWRSVEKLIPGIIDLHKDKMETVVMTKLIYQYLDDASLCYYPTLSVKGEDGVTTLYEANIWRKPGVDQGIQTFYFRKVSEPEEMKSKSSETEKTVSTKKMGEEGT